MIIVSCGASYKGNTREHNEDNIYVDGIYRENLSSDVFLIENIKDEITHLFAVFDGLGGESYGENASLIASKILKCYEDRCKCGILDVDEYLSEADKEIRKSALELGVRTMGTTAAVVSINNEVANIFNVGDSRVYLFRDDKLSQLSKDHSVVQTMIDLGFVKEEDRYRNIHSGELTQYLGMSSEDDIEPSSDNLKINLSKDDIIILCSDGLNSELHDSGIENSIIRSKELEPKYIATDLIITAKEGKCADNTSVIIAKCM